MARLNRVLDLVIFYLLAAALAAVAGICLAQVVARYLFSAAFTWAEEISIIILLWSVWGAACLALHRGLHLRVRLIDDRLGQRNLLLLRLGLNSLAVVFLVVVAWAGRTVIEGMAFMSLMSLPQVPVNTLYYSTPVGCLLLIYYLLRALAEDLSRLRAGFRRGA